MRSLNRFLLLSLLTIGCKGNTASDAPRATPSGPTSAQALSSCDEDATKLGAWLAEAQSEGMGPPAPFQQMGMKLVARSDGDAWAWFGTALLLDKDSVQLDFEKLGPPVDKGTRDKLAEQLKRRAQSALAAGVSVGLDVYLHQDTPWEVVVVVLDTAAQAGFRAIGLLFEGPSKLQAPASPLVAELRAADAKRLEEEDPLEGTPGPGAADKALATCRPMISLLREAGKQEWTPKERSELFSKRAPAAWLSCRCRAEADAVRAVQWHWLWRTYGPPTRAHRLLLASGGDKTATKVASAKSEPWSKVADEVVKASKAGERALLIAQ